MSSVRGVNNTLVNAGTSGSLIDAGVLRGKVRVYQDIYEAAALANGSDITMGKQLQPGTRVIGIFIAWDALGAGVTLDVGDANNADRYIDGEVATNPGSKWGDLVDGVNYEVTGTDDDLILITTGVGAATGTIKINILTAEE